MFCFPAQYHALGLLYHVRKNDRLAVNKMLSKFTRHGLKSPFAYCMMIRIASKLLEEEAGRWVGSFALLKKFPGPASTSSCRLTCHLIISVFEEQHAASTFLLLDKSRENIACLPGCLRWLLWALLSHQILSCFSGLFCITILCSTSFSLSSVIVYPACKQCCFLVDKCCGVYSHFLLCESWGRFPLSWQAESVFWEGSLTFKHARSTV